MTAKNEATAARPKSNNDAHWYSPEGAPVHTVLKADKSGESRPTDLRDARKLNLLPSVTNVIKLLHKEALVNWMIEQACLAILTAPRQKDEKDDDFVYRVLQVEQQQNQEAKIARDRGTDIHDALQNYFLGQEIPEEIKPWILPAAEKLMHYGELVGAEIILVGDGYAGMCDLILDSPEAWWIPDYKSTKRLPDKGSWVEHKLQTSAYAQAWADRLAKSGEDTSKPIRTLNCYISTREEGKFVIWENPDYVETYLNGFAPLVTYWQWVHKYRAKQVRPESPVTREDVEALKTEAEQRLPAEDQPAAEGAYEQSKTELLERAKEPPRPKNAPAGKKLVWSTGVPTAPK